MHQQIEDFLAFLEAEKGYSENTKVAYQNDLGQFVDYLANHATGVSEWGQVTKQHVIAFIMHMKGDLEYAASTTFVNENVEDAAALIAEYGILPSAEVAAKAIPGCNIVCITGAEMAPKIKTMFDVLFAANPASMGGALPAEDFYYVTE